MLEALLSSASSLIATLSGIGALGAVGLYALSKMVPAPLSTIAFIASIVVGAPAIVAWGTAAWAVLGVAPDLWAALTPLETLDDGMALLRELLLPIAAVVVTPIAGLVIAVSVAKAQFKAVVLAGVIALVAWVAGWDGVRDVLA